MRRQEQEERLSEQRIAPRVRPLTPIRRVQSTQTRTFGQPKLPDLYQRRMTSAPVLRNPAVRTALGVASGQVRDVRDVFVTDYGYDPGNPLTWEQANRKAIAEAQRRAARGVEGVRVRYPGDEETLAQGVGGTAAQIGGILNRQVPGMERVQQAVGEGARAIVMPDPQELVGLPGTSGIRRNIAEQIAQAAIPTHVWEVALELVPGIGTVPGAGSALRKAVSEAGQDLTVAGVRAFIKERGPAAVLDLVRATGGESGALRMDEFGRRVPKAVDVGSFDFMAASGERQKRVIGLKNVLDLDPAQRDYIISAEKWSTPQAQKMWYVTVNGNPDTEPLRYADALAKATEMVQSPPRQFYDVQNVTLNPKVAERGTKLVESKASKRAEEIRATEAAKEAERVRAERAHAEYRQFLTAESGAKGAPKTQVTIRGKKAGEGITDLATVDGVEPTPGLVVHRAWAGVNNAGEPIAAKGWQITHKATGMSVGSGITNRPEALAMARLLGRYGDWTTITVDNVPDWVQAAGTAARRFQHGQELMLPPALRMARQAEDLGGAAGEDIFKTGRREIPVDPETLSTYDLNRAYSSELNGAVQRVYGDALRVRADVAGIPHSRIRGMTPERAAAFDAKHGFGRAAGKLPDQPIRSAQPAGEGAAKAGTDFIRLKYRPIGKFADETVWAKSLGGDLFQQVRYDGKPVGSAFRVRPENVTSLEPAALVEQRLQGAPEGEMAKILEVRSPDVLKATQGEADAALKAETGIPASEMDDAVREALGDAGIPINDDGTVTLNHGTTEAGERGIREQNVLRSEAEPDVYVTTHAEDVGYGDRVVPVRVRVRDLILDDQFPNGRSDFRIRVKNKTYRLPPASEAASRLPGQPPAVGGGPPEPPVTTAIEPPDNFDGDVLTLTEAIRKSKRLRPEQQRAFAAERKIRAGRVGGILEGGRGDEAFQRAQGSLKGEFEGHATFEPPDIPEPRRLRMVEEIRTTDKIRPFEKLNAKQAFDKVMSGRLPEPAELEKLERVFGTDFSQAVLDKAPATWSQLVVDILTAPKALLASFDLSFPLRQGMVLAWSQPRAWLNSWKPMIKAFASEKYAKIADDAMRNDPMFSRYLDSGGYHAPLSGGARAMREESFASHLMDRLPGLGGSQRGFVTFGNKLRFESWKNLVEGTTAGGEAQDAVDAAFNQFVRHATGRGDVPFRAGEILPGLSAFFSLRNFVSRFQLLADPLTVKDAPLAVRAKIAGDLAKFFAGGVTFLGLIKMAHDNGVSGFENVTVEHDPRSTDFGKIRIGDRRYDLWTGYAQMARYSAQIMSGKRLAELPDGSLAPVPIDRKKYALRFIESKLDPTLALAIDLWTGETYTGEALKPDLKTLRREAFNRLVPLFIQDLTESLKKYGPLGPAFAAPSLIGAGSSDYPTTEGAKQYAMKQVLPERLDKLGFPSVERGFSSDYWQKRLPSKTVNPADFDNYSDYRAAYIEHWVEKRPADMSEALARDLAARKFDGLEAIKEFKRQRQEAEIKFWKDHPDLLQQALDANLEDWSGEKGEILESLR